LKREQKAQKVAELRERFDKASLIVLTDFAGLDVAKITDLRARIREAHGDYQVVKNTLIRLAAKETAVEKLAEYFVGPNGLAFGYDEVVPLAKALDEFVRENKKLALKAGLLEGGVVSAEGLKALAALPSREVLLARFLGALNAVPTNLVSVLAAVPRNLLGVLKAIEDQKAQAAA